jgi:hypothetical protein
MRTPNSISKERREEKFASAHERMRSTGKTGVVEPADGVDAGVVFLNGVAVYARYGEKKGKEALEALSSRPDLGVSTKLCSAEDVRMFRTYVAYLGDNAVVRAEPLDSTRLGVQRVEGVLVDGVKNLAAASWRGESTTTDRSFFPKGVRTALLPDLVSLRRHVSEAELTGYAAGKGKAVTFRNGELIDGAPVDLDESVREEVNAGGGWVVVDSDAEAGTEDESEAEEGILSRIL